MSLEPPSWWYGPDTAANRAAATALSPIAALYSAATASRFARAKPFRAPFAVICVGNLTAGGTGKTPLSRALGSIARHLGRTPAFLSRGYKGRLPGPAWVSSAHTAHDVGDEPLLLARDLPTLVARDRAEGARFVAATRSEVDLVIMDDGLQNPSLVKDLSIAVVDGQRGIGNGRVIPAGPLRAPLAFQRDLVDLVIVNHGSRPSPDTAPTLTGLFDPPVETRGMRIEPRPPGWQTEASRAIAYAGIGNPENFFQTLSGLGIELVETRAFPDHHDWREADCFDLLARARHHGVPLITTEKDHARLDPRDGSQAALAEASRVLAIDVVFEEVDLTALKTRISALVR